MRKSPAGNGLTFRIEKETAKLKKLSARQITLMAFCLLLGLVAKKIISPVTNVLTDFFRIPGGSAAVGFSLAFLVIGRELVPMPGAATAMGFVQALLAIALGMSGYQGPLALLTYTLPGIVIDLTALFMKRRGPPYFILASVLACEASALLSELLVFHLSGAALVLWQLIAACSGVIGGICAYILYTRIAKIIKIGG